MFIKKIKIENFRSFEKVELDFTVNKNGIEKDLIVNRFKLLDNKIPITSVTALVGRNSVGKTTILRSISFLRDIETQIVSRYILQTLSAESVNSLYANNQQLNIAKDMLTQQKNSNDLINRINKEISERKGIYFKKYLEKISNWLSDFFDKNAHNPKIYEMKFTIEFIGKNNKFSTYEVSINKDGILNRAIEGDFSYEDIVKYFQKTIAPSRMIRYGSSNNLAGHPNETNVSSYFNMGNVGIALSNIIRIMGKDKAIDIINLADEDVIGIKYKQQENGNIEIENLILRKSKIYPNHLSQGTKQFILNVEAILRTFKKQGEFGLILIDEIESNMHNELIVSLLNMLIKIFKLKNIQSIITTHNVSVLPRVFSNKQILSIQKINGKHTIKRASSFMKSHESIANKYEKGIIAGYPDEELIRNTMANIFSDI